jgi:hypothetical protein
MPYKIPQTPISSRANEQPIVRQEVQHHHHHHSNTIIREIPVVDASLNSLSVSSITVTGSIAIPDPSVFYPPKESFVELRAEEESVVGFRVDKDAPFFTYDPATGNATLPTFVSPNATIESLTAGRFTVSVAEFGHVLMKEGSVYAPESAHVGGHLVATTGAIGGVQCKNARMMSTSLKTEIVEARTVACEYLDAERIHCAAPHITLGGVRLLSGGIDAMQVFTEEISAHKSMFDAIHCGELSSISDRLSVTSGIVTPPESCNELGCLRADRLSVCVSGQLIAKSIETPYIGTGEVSTTELKVWGAGTIADVQINRGEVHATAGHFGGVHLSNSTVVAEGIRAHHSILNTQCLREELLVGENIVLRDGAVRAADFRLNDGTSILNGVFPPGMIMLFHGKVAPRGWMECNGKGGTPTLAPPAAGVIYIVRR